MPRVTVGRPIVGLAALAPAAWMARKLRGERVVGAPLEATLVKLAYKRAGRWAGKQVLLGRYVDREAPEKGRITNEQFERVLARTWDNYDELAPGAHIERIETPGSRQNVLLGVFSLAIYRALLAEGIEQSYATELVADLAWKVYEKWIVAPRFVARLKGGNPQEQMNSMLRMFLRFPFNRPGYEWKVNSGPDSMGIDFYRCPVRDYLASEGEEEFMRNTWCTLDFALAQAMVRGGRYERPRTLSAGDNLCEMKWFAGAPHGGTP
jgi:hypothetical protein